MYALYVARDLEFTGKKAYEISYLSSIVHPNSDMYSVVSLLQHLVCLVSPEVETVVHFSVAKIYQSWKSEKLRKAI